MKKIVTGKCHVFGNNIDTDQICPGAYLELTDPKEIASHCLEGADPEFKNKFAEGDIIIAGTNFGCGSSREHAAISLKNVGAGAVVAESFARIFYRNGINMGLSLIIAPGISELVNTNDELTLDTTSWTIKNLSTNKEIKCEAISDYAMNILNAGGIKPLLLQNN